MALSGTVEHATPFSEQGTPPDAAEAWNGTGAHTVVLSGEASLAQGGTGNATGTATVNANLTGPVTSLGNATTLVVATAFGSTFAPAVTAETNTTATMSLVKHMRVGNVVSMSGQFTADPLLTATTTSFEFSLPVASNIGAVSDISGMAFCGAIAGMGAEIFGVVANDTAKVRFISSDINSQTWSWFAQYTVI